MSHKRFTILFLSSRNFTISIDQIKKFRFVFLKAYNFTSAENWSRCRKCLAGRCPGRARQSGLCSGSQAVGVALLEGDEAGQLGCDAGDDENGVHLSTLLAATELPRPRQ